MSSQPCSQAVKWQLGKPPEIDGSEIQLKTTWDGSKTL